MSVACPHCGLEQQPKLTTRPGSREYDRRTLGIDEDPINGNDRFTATEVPSKGYWAIAQCLRSRCREVYLLSREISRNDWRVAIIIPNADTDYLGETPEPVKSAIAQAKKCLAIGCPDAAAAMCRAALERMVKDKKAEGPKLFNKLKNLLAQGLLTKMVYDAADTVRDWGNTALHELLAEPVDEETVKKLVTLTDMVARDLYITPAQIKTLDGEANKDG